MTYEVVKMRPSQALLNRIADWAAELLKESDNPQAEMKWAEERLREAGLFPLFLNPDLNNPQKWADEVIAQNLNMEDESVPWVKAHNSHPERAETFEGLILSLIPTEGGL